MKLTARLRTASEVTHDSSDTIAGLGALTVAPRPSSEQTVDTTIRDLE